MNDSFRRSSVPSRGTASSLTSRVQGGDGTADPEPSIKAEAHLSIDGVDDAVLSDLLNRIHIDVVVHNGSHDQIMHHVPVRLDAPGSTVCVDTKTATPEGVSRPDDIVSKRAVVAMSGRIPHAENLFRTVAVTLDATPGNQVEGISPLYHVSNLDGPETLSAVVELSSKLAADTLVGVLRSVEMSHEGAVELRLVDMEDVVCDTEICTVPWPPARSRAAVLAPWFDMDPGARYGDEPISFLLSMAPDAARVGMVSDHWIIGELQ